MAETPITYQNCVIEGDLAKMVRDFERDVGLALAEWLEDLDAIDFDTGELDDADKNLRDLNLNPDDLADDLGTPNNNTEERLLSLGLVGINCKIFMADNSGNIEALRKLYMASDENMTVLEEALGTNNLLVVYSQREEKVFGPKPDLSMYSDSELTTKVGRDVKRIVNRVDVESDSFVHYFKKVGQNKDLNNQAALMGITASEVLPQIFWFGSVNPDRANTKQLQNYNLDTVQIDASLWRRNYQKENIEILRQDMDALEKVLYELEVLCFRGATASRDEQIQLAKTLRANEPRMVERINTLYAKVFWDSTLVVDPNMLTTLREKLTEPEIVYLLRDRRDVTGINLSATRQELNQAISEAIAVKAGSKVVSNFMVNNRKAERPEKRLYAVTSYYNKARIFWNKSDVGDKEFMSGKSNIREARNALINLNTELEASFVENTESLSGVKSYDSGASLLVGLCIEETLGVSDIVKEMLEQEPDPTLAAYVAAIIAGCRAGAAAINALTDKMDEWLRKAEKYATLNEHLTGAGILENSIMRCSLGGTLDVDAAPFGYFENPWNQLLSDIQKLAAVTANFIETLLCKPLALINSLTGGVEQLIPGQLCKFQELGYPQPIHDLLNELRNACGLHQSSVRGFFDSLHQITAIVHSQPEHFTDLKRAQGMCKASEYFDFGIPQILPNIPSVTLPTPTVPAWFSDSAAQAFTDSVPNNPFSG